MVVSVRDNGHRHPRRSRCRSIFDMFSQVDRSIERSTGGLGIGLALVKGLVEMHGGTVTAESDGPGTGQHVHRPPAGARRADAEPAAAGPPEERPAAAGPKRRILVVDDNRDSAPLDGLLLELLGNEVRTAHDGLEAVQAAEAFRPEVILMDVGMPRLNGYEATRRIREQPWGRAVIIIALTGWGQEGDRRPVPGGRLRRPPGQAGRPRGPGEAPGGAGEHATAVHPPCTRPDAIPRTRINATAESSATAPAADCPDGGRSQRM